MASTTGASASSAFGAGVARHDAFYLVDVLPSLEGAAGERLSAFTYVADVLYVATSTGRLLS